MGDYIDRESLIKDFVGYCNHLSQVCHSNDDVYAEMFGIVQCLNRVESAPTADVVEVRHGEWVEHDESKDDFYHHRCSICKVDAVFNYVETEDFDEGMDGEWYSMGMSITDIVEHLTNYCPNCGAKMDGKGEGE